MYRTLAMLFAVWAAAATVGAVVAAWAGQRLPRFTTYVVAFLIGGAPRMIVLAFDAPMWTILAVSVAGGLASGFINPILGAVIYERIPRHLMGRVTALSTSLAWSLIPFGGVVGGATIAGIGLSPALLVLGLAYLVATMLPTVRPPWRELDRSPGSGHQRPDDRVREQPAVPGEDEAVPRRLDEPVRDQV